MIDRQRLAELHALEEQRFVDTHPRSAARAADARNSLLGGVPMAWMTRWPGAFPLFFDHAEGARFTDVDGIEYVDFCLGDTGAMTGHALPQLADALAAQARRGITTMLPSTDAAWVGDELARRFGLPVWQMAMTATDANRFVLRLARHLTGRPKVAVFDWCYHGTVDEAFAVLDDDGRVVAREGNTGPAVDPTVTTTVVPFNDVAALEAALAAGDVACVLAEPALTNIGIVLPEPGFMEGLRELATRYGALLMIDETHTFSAGWGGATAAWDLEPDIFVIGKSIGGGIPCGAYGITTEVAASITSHTDAGDADIVDVGGVGGTLAGNALSTAAMRATLGEVLTHAAFEHMIDLATAFTEGVQVTLDEFDVPWSVSQLGARSEYRFASPAPRTGEEAAVAHDDDLDAYMHLAMCNRGILMTPFHNMALMCPETTRADVDRHTATFREVVAALYA